MNISLINFNASMVSATKEDQASGIKLQDGVQKFLVKAVKEISVPSKFSDDCTALEMDFLLNDTVRAPHIRLYLNTSRKNQEAFLAFMHSIGMIAEDGSCKATNWDELVGKRGRAFFVSKTLSHGGMVYDPIEWLPYDETKMSPKASDYQPF